MLSLDLSDAVLPVIEHVELAFVFLLFGFDPFFLHRSLGRYFRVVIKSLLGFYEALAPHFESEFFRPCVILGLFPTIFMLFIAPDEVNPSHFKKL